MTPTLKFGLSPETIERLNSVFKKYPSIEKVVLYGSRAKGNFKPTSDIDLSIFAMEADLSFLFKLEREIDDLLLPYTIDLSVFAALDNEELKDHISRVGQVFYSKA